MQTRNRLFDDLSQVMTSAMGTMQGARDEVENLVRRRLETMLDDMDLVSREEFDVVREMAQQARLENDALRAEIESLRDEVQKLASKPRRAARTTRKTTDKSTD